MVCPECGAVVFKDQELCPNCHYPLHGSPTANKSAERKNRDEVVTPADLQPVSEVEKEATEVVDDGNSQTPTEQKPRKKSYVAIVIGVVIVLLVCFVAAYFYKTSQNSNEADAYAEAMLSDQPSVLQNYLDIYKDAPEEHRDSIEAHLASLMSIDKEWTDVLVSGSKTAIERYLQMHPNSPHATEAKIKIDSLDWVAASKANTPEALLAYMDGHSDGLYYDQAKEMHDKLDAQKVSDVDKQKVSTLFNGYFRALGANDEDALTANIANIMDSFLNKADATKNDVITYMKKLHSKPGQSSIEFRTNNDWKIAKAAVADGSGYEYTVDFSVDEKTVAAEEEQAKIETYVVNAKVSADGKISSLNMKHIKQ